MGIVNFSPLAEGVLSGKYNDQVPPDSRAADEKAGQFIQPRLSQENLAKLKKLVEVADGLQIAMAVLALAWCLRRPELTSCIIGASRTEQIEENVKACDVKLDDAVMDRISAILGGE